MKEAKSHLRFAFQIFMAWVCALVASSSVWGQIGEIDAEFAGAGARPLSMGGAFIGLADDSTAAEFNPAGIQILRRPEFAWQVTRTYDRRQEFLPVTSLDEEGAIRGVDSNQWTTPSFISYVKPGQDYTIALSQLTTIDFVHHFDDMGRDFDFNSMTEVTNNAFGLTLAKDIQPRLHVGMTLRMNRFNFSGIEGPRSLEFTDWSPSVNMGILWRATKDWSYGAVFKSSQRVNALDGDIDTSLPETWGVGVAYHPNSKLRILADVDYINWSEFDNVTSDDYRRNDVTRLHFGGEYLFRLEEERAWFVRGGYMREEANTLYYDGPSLYPIDPSAGLPEPDDLDHISFGLGLAAEKYQIDFAVNRVLDGGTILILSMIHYF